MSETSRPLVVIGGHEDKEGDRVILKCVAEHVGKGRLVIATVASHEPDGYFHAYREAFADLGVTDLIELYVHDRSEALDGRVGSEIVDAAGVFFTGGDQLRISSQIGDTPLFNMLHDLHARGGIIAGTSAGASVMSETMLVGGPSSESHRVGDLRIAPGLGLIPGVIIDRHFSERGRIGRLLGAVAQNPRVLGIGIDEDTAIDLCGSVFRVIGARAVTIVDGAGVTRSNIAEGAPDRTLSIHDVALHILSDGDEYDLSDRRPRACDAPERETYDTQMADHIVDNPPRAKRR